MKNLLKRFNSTSLRFRLILIFSILILASVILHGIIMTRIMSDSVLERYQHEMNYRCSQLQQQVDDLFTECRDIVYEYAYDKDIQDVLQNTKEKTTATQRKYIIEKILLAGKLKSGKTVSAFIYDNEGNCYTNDYLSILPYEEIANDIESQGQRHLHLPTMICRTSADHDYSSIIMAREIFDSTGRNRIGTVAIRLDPKYLKDLCVETFQGADGHVQIRDQEGKLVSSDLGQIVMDEDDYYSFESATDTRGWRYIAKVNKDSIRSARWKAQKITYIILVVMVLLTGLALIYFSTHVVTPLNKLKRSIESFEDTDMTSSTTFRPKYDDEIGQLAKSYNAMTERLRTSAEHIKSIEEQKQRAEVKMYETQISPHFLYNTLSSIIWMVHKNNKDEAIDMMESLARFYQISLSKGREFITVREEFNHVESYLKIQEKRYKGVFSYTIDLEKDIEEELIMKVILQPLVENAIYHGIKELAADGIIIIRGNRMGEKLLLEVIDNGGKMSVEKCRRINAAIDGGEGVLGIGISNVIARLRLYYGKEFNMKYMVSGRFTMVNIELPIKEEKQNV